MLTLEMAKRIIEASERKAKELGITVSTVVVDTHGTIIAMSRMDNSLVISPKYAYAKAYTSAVLKFPTNALGEYAVEGKPYFGMTSIFGGELTTISGGLPIVANSNVVGGVGVGGSADVSQDLACAEAGLSAL